MHSANFSNNYLASEITQNIEDTLNYILFNLGIMPNIQGFKYIKECVKYYAKRDEYGKKIAQSAYVYVASIRNIPISSVERAIRHAISVSFASNKIRNLNNIMKVKVISDYYKPTNSELLSLLSEKIKSQFNLYDELTIKISN